MTPGDCFRRRGVARRDGVDHLVMLGDIGVGQVVVEGRIIDAQDAAAFVEQARESGKPDNIIEKMVEGRMRKFFEEVVLLSQAFVINPDQTVAAALTEAEKAIGAPAKITGFVRVALGEGIEKEESDFAAEVAAAAKG